MSDKKKILITGANGYIGRQLGQYLQQQEHCEVLGIDLHIPSENLGFTVLPMDIRSAELSTLVKQHDITHVVHLASIVSPGRNESLEYDIDVNGTANVIAACKANQVRHLTVTSSGAAYGYHADNPEWLRESDPLRGNDEFSYSRHKKLVEIMLAEFAACQTITQVLVMRPCTVLGKSTDNKITDLFKGKRLLGVGQAESPFVFVWDQDVIAALVHGVTFDIAGQFNLAGDGKVTLEQLAFLTHKKIRRLPAILIKAALWVGKTLRISSTGPEQLMFLQYRPVLANDKLKTVFGYIPQKSSLQVFEYFWAHQGSQEKKVN